MKIIYPRLTRTDTQRHKRILLKLGLLQKGIGYPADYVEACWQQFQADLSESPEQACSQPAPMPIEVDDEITQAA